MYYQYIKKVLDLAAPVGLGAAGLQVVSGKVKLKKETTWRPATPKPGGKIQNVLNIRKLQLKTFCQITSLLTPKTKPILQFTQKCQNSPSPLICKKYTHHYLQIC